jgi:hypothetical protein
MHFAPEVARMIAINHSGMDMKPFAAVILSVLLFSSSSKAEEGMSVETSWDHIPRCAGRLGKNATMKIRNAPRGTKFISATLTSGACRFFWTLASGFDLKIRRMISQLSGERGRSVAQTYSRMTARA